MMFLFFMKNKRTLASRVIAPIVLGASLAGCVSAPVNYSMKGIPLGNGYSVENKSERLELNTLLGVIYGDIKVKRTKDGFMGKGTFSPISHSDYRKQFDTLCRVTDRDGDKLLTEKEIQKIKAFIYESKAE
jgi:hypothetical protein